MNMLMFLISLQSIINFVADRVAPHQKLGAGVSTVQLYRQYNDIHTNGQIVIHTDGQIGSKNDCFCYTVSLLLQSIIDYVP